MRLLRQFQPGQSLIEVSFATGVVSLVLVAVLSSVIQSVQNSRVAIEQTRSTNFAQEGLEWTRAQRDTSGWGLFYSALSTRQGAGSSIIYCVPSLPDTLTALVAQASGECADDNVIAGTGFRRELEFSVQSATKIVVTSRVIRAGEAGEVTTSLDVTFSDYQ